VTTPDFLHVSGAAKALGVSPQTLRNWTKLGHINAQRHAINGYRIYLRGDVEKLANRLPLASDSVTDAKNIDWDFPGSSSDDSIHAFHPYPAKFIPEIPRALIELFPPPKGSCVFDPFCGSGTTLVEAQVKGYDSVGVDLNPIACMLSRVKTSTIPSDFEAEYIRILNEVSFLKIDLAYREEIPNVRHWFKDDIAQELDKLRRAIATAPTDTRRFLDAALSSIVVRVSNQDSDTRYATVNKNTSADSVCILFRSTCRRIMNLWGRKTDGIADSVVIQNDVRALVDCDIPFPIGLTITSPPYPNAYEYWLYHKYRMYWLRHDPIAVKEKEIGARAHYFKKSFPSDDDFLSILKKLLTVTYNRSVTNAYACIVIGRSIIHGRVVDNASLTVRAATEAGFSFVTKLNRTINSSRKSFNLSHARIANEDILIFKKN